MAHYWKEDQHCMNDDNDNGEGMKTRYFPNGDPNISFISMVKILLLRPVTYAALNSQVG